MKHLLLFTLAALWCRLKPTVTALLQHPLQKFRALARAGDTLARFTPPHHLHPLTPRDAGYRRAVGPVDPYLLSGTF